MSKALLVFVKNRVAGKTKTRIAVTVGNQRALEIYEELLDINSALLQQFSHSTYILFNQETENNSRWELSNIRLGVQAKGDLGERMHTAFMHAFEKYETVLLIGSDCPYLTIAHLNQAYEALESHDVVLGPALDGGYYLVGLKKEFASLFVNKEWSHDRVLEEAVQSCQRYHKSYALLESLSDIDTYQDWVKYKDTLS